MIIIDSGHNARNGYGTLDRGCQATYNGTTYYEADIAERIKWRMCELLRAGGEPTYSPPYIWDTRTRYYESAKHAPGAKLYISLHINAAESRAANGTETFWSQFQDRLYANTMAYYLHVTNGFANRGAKQNAAVAAMDIKRRIPYVLVEVGFLTNVNDWRKIMLIEAVAGGLAFACLKYTGIRYCLLEENNSRYYDSERDQYLDLPQPLQVINGTTVIPLRWAQQKQILDLAYLPNIKRILCIRAKKGLKTY
jgi:hypothetical protein